LALVGRLEVSIGEASLFGIHGVGIQNFDREVVDQPAVPWILDQHQLVRGLCDRELA
jgi:hypothetical protein